MQLVDWYRCYYENPSKGNAQQLFRALMTYDYADFEDFQNLAWETRASFPTREGLKKRDGFSAMSSGTLSPPSIYDVGPNGRWWQRQIERFIKNPTGRSNILLMSCFHPNTAKFMDNVVVMNRFHRSHLYKEYLKLDPVTDLRNAIWLLRNTPSLVLTLKPSLLLYLARENEFIEYLVEAGVTLCTTGYESFYPDVPVHVNDNMIDWKTGLNFWTCPHGTKHFLPFFAMRDNRAYNLVNLHCGYKTVDDLFITNPQVSQCSCGRKFLSFDFIPHIRAAIRRADSSVFYDLEIPNKLEGQYQNFQFVQKTDDSIDVLYVCGNCRTMPQQDEEFIGQTLAGFDFSFKKDKYLAHGQKFSAFCKNICEHPYQQWPRHKPRYL